MKKRWKFLIGVLILLVCFSCFFMWRKACRTYTRQLTNPIIERKVEQLRIATYNVKSFNGGDKGDIKKAAEEIKDLDVDILNVQEVDEHTFRSNNIKMVEELAKEAGFPYYYFFQSVWVVNGYYGLGILSKYPIQEVSSMQLSKHILEEPRILAKAVIQINDAELSVYNTHLAFKERAARLDQIDQIAQQIAGNKNTILMGDFNTFQVSEFFTIPNMEAVNTANHTYLTFRTFGFPDNIYLSKEITLQHADVKQSEFSDHNLFYCDVKVALT